MEPFSLRTTFLLIVVIVLPILKLLTDRISYSALVSIIWIVTSISLLVGFGFVIMKMMDDVNSKKMSFVEKVFYLLLPLIFIAELFWISLPIHEFFKKYFFNTKNYVAQD